MNHPDLTSPQYSFLIAGFAVALGGALYLAPSSRARRRWNDICKATNLSYTRRTRIKREEVKRSPSVRRYRRTDYGFNLHVRLPVGAKPADIDNHADEIAWGLGALRVRPEVIKPRRMLIRVYRRDPLVNRDLRARPRALNHDGTIDVAITESGPPLALDLDQTPHILVGGTTGAGKTNAVNVMIDALRTSGADVVAIDLGEVDMASWVDLGLRVETEIPRAVELLGELVTEMGYRIQLVRQQGKARMADVPMPNKAARKVLVIDEAQLLLHPGRDKESRGLAADAELALFQLLSKSRKAGMSIILSTQRPGTDVIPSRLRDLCSVRIALRTETRDATDMILGSGSAALGAEPHRIPANLPGVAIVRVDGSEFARVRFPQFRVDSFRGHAQ